MSGLKLFLRSDSVQEGMHQFAKYCLDERDLAIRVLMLGGRV